MFVRCSSLGRAGVRNELYCHCSGRVPKEPALHQNRGCGHLPAPNNRQQFGLNRTEPRLNSFNGSVRFRFGFFLTVQIGCRLLVVTIVCMAIFLNQPKGSYCTRLSVGNVVHCCRWNLMYICMRVTISFARSPNEKTF